MYLVHSHVLVTVDILEMDLLVKVSIKIIVTRIAHTCNKHALIPSNYIDINECSSNPCGTNAMCTDVPGSFSCACNSGFSGDGFTCQSKV